MLVITMQRLLSFWLIIFSHLSQLQLVSPSSKLIIDVNLTSFVNCFHRSLNLPTYSMLYISNCREMFLTVVYSFNLSVAIIEAAILNYYLLCNMYTCWNAPKLMCMHEIWVRRYEKYIYSVVLVFVKFIQKTPSIYCIIQMQLCLV